MKALFTNNSGSSLVESILVMNLLFFLFCGLLIFSFYFYTKVALQVSLHEGIVCSIREQRTHTCKRWLKKRLKKIIFYGKLSRLQIYKQNSRTYGYIKWKFANSSNFSIAHSYNLKNTLIKPTKRALF